MGSWRQRRCGMSLYCLILSVFSTFLSLPSFPFETVLPESSSVWGSCYHAKTKRLTTEHPLIFKCFKSRILGGRFRRKFLPERRAKELRSEFSCAGSPIDLSSKWQQWCRRNGEKNGKGHLGLFLAPTSYKLPTKRMIKWWNPLQRTPRFGWRGIWSFYPDLCFLLVWGKFCLGSDTAEKTKLEIQQSFGSRKMFGHVSKAVLHWPVLHWPPLSD